MFSGLVTKRGRTSPPSGQWASCGWWFGDGAAAVEGEERVFGYGAFLSVVIVCQAPHPPFSEWLVYGGLDNCERGTSLRCR